MTDDFALRIGRIDLYDADDPLLQDYENAIQLAQNGEFNNWPKRGRFLVRHQLAAHALKRFPLLDVVECGCWRGHSTLMIGWQMQRAGGIGRLHVFDSFEGLSGFTEKDRNGAPNLAKEAKQREHFRSNVEDFRRLMGPFGFVDIYPGWIPERFPEVAEREFSFLSLDVDLYEPTLASLQFFYPRMPAGAGIYMDDYGSKNYPGARRAAEEFFADNPVSFLLRLPTGGAIALK